MFADRVFMRDWCGRRGNFTECTVLLGRALQITVVREPSRTHKPPCGCRIPCDRMEMIEVRRVLKHNIRYYSGIAVAIVAIALLRLTFLAVDGAVMELRGFGLEDSPSCLSV